MILSETVKEHHGFTDVKVCLSESGSSLMSVFDSQHLASLGAWSL